MFISGDDDDNGGDTEVKGGGNLKGPLSDRTGVPVGTTDGKEGDGDDDDGPLAGRVDSSTCPNPNPGRTVDATGGKRYNRHQLILPDASTLDLETVLPSVVPALVFRVLSTAL